MSLSNSALVWNNFVFLLHPHTHTHTRGLKIRIENQNETVYKMYVNHDFHLHSIIEYFNKPVLNLKSRLHSDYFLMNNTYLYY